MRIQKLAAILAILALPAFAASIADVQKSLGNTAIGSDLRTPSAAGPQWDSWNPASPTDLGSPTFKAISNGNSTLLYGFRGAVVINGGKADRVRMNTITRSKVEGYVNQINSRFALAAGLHDIAVYDFSKGKWFVKERVTPDDSTGALKENLVLGADFVQVRQLNGPIWRYTSATGWQEIRK